MAGRKATAKRTPEANQPKSRRRPLTSTNTSFDKILQLDGAGPLFRGWECRQVQLRKQQHPGEATEDDVGGEHQVRSRDGVAGLLGIKRVDSSECRQTYRRQADDRKTSQNQIRV